jgi:hypothetical protein
MNNTDLIRFFTLNLYFDKLHAAQVPGGTWTRGDNRLSMGQNKP